MEDEDRVVVADLLKPRGIRGELLAISQTDVPGRLESLKEVRAHLGNGTDVPVTIETAWAYRHGWVVKLEGVDSIEEAEPFRGAELWVTRSERGALPRGEYFRSDLMGCELRDRETGALHGIVAGWEQYGGPLLLSVTCASGEQLVPFVDGICRSVDLARKQIFVDLPDGLLDP